MVLRRAAETEPTPGTGLSDRARTGSDGWLCWDPLNGRDSGVDPPGGGLC